MELEGAVENKLMFLKISIQAILGKGKLTTIKRTESNLNKILIHFLLRYYVPSPTTPRISNLFITLPMLGIFIKTNSSYGESHKTWHNRERPKILQKAIVKRLLEKKNPPWSTTHPFLIARQSAASWGKKKKTLLVLCVISVKHSNGTHTAHQYCPTIVTDNLLLHLWLREFHSM